jgi:hypothetical protein
MKRKMIIEIIDKFGEFISENRIEFDSSRGYYKIIDKLKEVKQEITKELSK